MTNSFGVFPDGQDRPAAVFDDLEDAIEWGLGRFGGDRFAIRHCSLALLPVSGEAPCRNVA